MKPRCVYSVMMMSEEDVLSAHGPLVWSLCRRLADEPEDCYQQIWEKVLRALPRFDDKGPASLRTWIATIAHRHLVDRHRRKTVRGVLVPVDGLVAPPRAQAALEGRERKERLEEALQRLPEEQRRVVVLHHIHGVPLATLADQEEVAVGTIKSRLHRGRAALARMLR